MKHCSRTWTPGVLEACSLLLLVQHPANLNGDKIIESFLDFSNVIGPNGSGSDRVSSLVSVVVTPRTTSHPLSYRTWPADRFSLWDAVLHLQPHLSITAERFTPWNPRSLKVWVLLQFEIMAVWSSCHFKAKQIVSTLGCKQNQQRGVFTVWQLVNAAAETCKYISAAPLKMLKFFFIRMMWIINIDRNN